MGTPSGRTPSSPAPEPADVRDCECQVQGYCCHPILQAPHQLSNWEESTDEQTGVRKSSGHFNEMWIIQIHLINVHDQQEEQHQLSSLLCK
ncbi:ORF268 [White spot syndrome virus]|uniref:ORF268 n=1 Tax=White spot syndrome virus TaxID=342409 RepID=A0A2D3I5R3_9VIRU|nr:ORF268 [White spot syndrome virus]